MRSFLLRLVVGVVLLLSYESAWSCVVTAAKSDGNDSSVSYGGMVHYHLRPTVELLHRRLLLDGLLSKSCQETTLEDEDLISHIFHSKLRSYSQLRRRRLESVGMRQLQDCNDITSTGATAAEPTAGVTGISAVYAPLDILFLPQEFDEQHQYKEITSSDCHRNESRVIRHENLQFRRILQQQQQQHKMIMLKNKGRQLPNRHYNNIDLLQMMNQQSRHLSRYEVLRRSQQKNEKKVGHENARKSHNSSLLPQRRKLQNQTPLQITQHQQQQQQNDQPYQNNHNINNNNNNNAKSFSNTNEYQITPLLQGYGTHYVTAWVGSPLPQRKTVIVDTGSHYTAFPCIHCINCGEEYHTDYYFNYSQSNTFEIVPCRDCQEYATCSSTASSLVSRGDDGGGDGSNKKEDGHHDVDKNELGAPRCQFSQKYTEGSSWNAYQVRDQYFIGGNDRTTGPVDSVHRSFAIEFMFGCQTSETGLFRTQLADGIMGMSAHEATLPKQMYNEGKLRHNMFTLCFRHELSVSKNGVTAGVMTLGGMDNRLNLSPMVYAKNISPDGGWYTVFVKNIFLLEGTGTDEDKYANNLVINETNKGRIHHVNMNANHVNNGKGVIVDSGTTDTYLSKSLQEEFARRWLQATGNKIAYSNNEAKLSREQVLSLPTILIQLQAFDPSSPREVDPNTVPGLVGSTLDDASPRDILLAISPTHYLEYLPSKDTYTSRIYFTEFLGGVIGANAMQGHSILFDWENGRIGFAASTCDHDDLLNNEVSHMVNKKVGHLGKEGGVVDCALSPPSLATTCVESVDKESCVNDPTMTISGFEKWVRVVEIGSSPTGKSCAETARNFLQDYPDATAECSEDGLCFEIRPCAVTCTALLSMPELKPMEVHPQQKVDAIESINGRGCGDNLFGECLPTCVQSKILSVLMDDGNCHAVGKATSRPCHTGKCGNGNPCVIPFVVHVILGFHFGNVTLWDKFYEQLFNEALASTLRKIAGESNHTVDIGSGDVNVLMASRWRKEGIQSETEAAGMKLIAVIAVYNTNLSLASDESVQYVKCHSNDLFEYGRNAVHIRDALQKNDFFERILQATSHLTEQMNTVIGTIQRGDGVGPFTSVDHMQSEVIASWTMRTDISEVPGSTDERPPASGNIASAFRKDTRGMPMKTIALAAILLFVSGGAYVGARRDRRRPDNEFPSTSLMSRIRQRRSMATPTDEDRGRYKRLSTRRRKSSSPASKRRRGRHGIGNDGDIELA